MIRNLIDTKTNEVLATLEGTRVIVPPGTVLEAELEKGIYIPPAMRANYQGREYVYRKDKLFAKAFEEIYCRMTLKHASQYIWKDVK